MNIIAQQEGMSKSKRKTDSEGLLVQFIASTHLSSHLELYLLLPHRRIRPYANHIQNKPCCCKELIYRTPEFFHRLTLTDGHYLQFLTKDPSLNSTFDNYSKLIVSEQCLLRRWPP